MTMPAISFHYKIVKPLIGKLDQSVQEPTNFKEEIPRKDESLIEMEQNLYHSPLVLELSAYNPDQRVTPPLIQLDSHDESDKIISEPTTTSQKQESANTSTFQFTEQNTSAAKTKKEIQNKNCTSAQSLAKDHLEIAASKKNI